ncbi:hypothetical protein B0X71_17030 [Planococcus lenghuensis]|uniref:Glycine transporter domain-containing protein n=1 Tax=Planococcus lenghuensis TaxID=2213202 RepID=A0A1Q2L2I3_9BACL|nr:hypothetical protein B0X71_17030 [Planococcus lenghuensis]
MAWELLSMIGTVAFAISGAFIAMEEKYDISGVFILGGAGRPHDRTGDCARRCGPYHPVRPDHGIAGFICPIQMAAAVPACLRWLSLEKQFIHPAPLKLMTEYL